MIAIFRASLLALVACCACVQAGLAATLRVTPVLIDLTAPTGAGAMTLVNEDTQPVTVQLRIFRWVQENGEDKYLPTREVVASPPISKLAPGAKQTVRVVRVGPPATGQESYRLFVDEVPQPSKKRQSGVSFVIRQSIPVFFSSPVATRPDVSWSASVSGKSLTIAARNQGNDRMKVSALLVKDASGKVLARVPGLAGYVLGDSTRQWHFPLPAGVALRGHPVILTAVHDRGDLRVDLAVASGG